MKERLIQFIVLKWQVSKQVVKFIISGGMAALTELVLSYVFTEYFGMWYLLSFFLAFCVAFVVSSSMQKFWTFEDRSTDGIHKQATAYFIITASQLGANAGALYVLVEFLGVWYILAQIIIGAFLAFISFVIYKYFVFHE